MKLKQTPIASAVALALMSAAFHANAQQADTKPAPKQAADKTAVMETVVVTGIRASLEKSLEAKRDSDSHVEVITAEDIGKMPDKNVADSLQRVPGVTISSAGATEGGFDENDRVSLRGTNPSLTQTLINGHGVASGDWFVLNQTGTVGRSVSYTLLPSELVGQVVVHKSSEASLVEGGVAGSIDIITRKPLDFRKPLTLEASLGGVYASLPKKSDPQVSALLNWKNDERTVGVLLQGFSEKRHLRRDGVEILGYDQISPTSDVVMGRNGNTPHPDLANVWIPHDIGAALFEQERKRDGGLVDIQVKPNSDLSMDFSAFTSKMNATNYNRNYLLWTPHFMNGGAGQAPDPGYVISNNTLVSANFKPVAGTQYGIYDQISRPNESADSNFFSFDAKFRANDKLTLSSKIGTSTGHGKTPTQDVAEWDFAVGSGASYHLNGTNNAPDFGFGNTNNSNLSGVAGLDWIFGDQNMDVVDKEKWAQLDGEYAIDAGTLTTLKFGVRRNTHERSLTGIINQRPALDGSAFNSANWPQGYTNYSNFGSRLGGNFPRDVWYYTAGQLAAFDSQFAYRPSDGSREPYSEEYGLKETNSAGYVQANFEGTGWSGNAGVRLVQTKEHVLSYNSSTPQTPGVITTSLFGPFVITPTDHTYNDVLPSANLKIDLAKDLVGRVAISKTMTRADYSALAGGVSLSPPAAAGQQGSGSGGNPDLKPIRSTNLDATAEWYFAPRSLASAGLFYMKLDNYIGLGQVTKTFTDFSNAFPNGHLVDYVLSVPINSKGSVKGFELSYEQPLMGNFGVATNYTYADAKEDGGGPLVGASKNTYNVSGYFENNLFSARVSYTYRSSFYSGLDRNTAFYQDDVGNLSAALGYKVTENLNITLDALNLNDPKLKYYALNKDQPRSIYQNGRQYYLNLRLKF
jgi:iron complex outermembrane recepter protein